MKFRSSFTSEALNPSWLINVVNKLTIALFLVNSELPPNEEAVG